MEIGEYDEKPPSSKSVLCAFTRGILASYLQGKQLWRQWADRFDVADLRHLHHIGLGRCGSGYLDICPKVIDADCRS